MYSDASDRFPHSECRHCQCVYYQDWHRTRRPKQAVEGGILPGVSRAVAPSSEVTTAELSSPRNTLESNTGVVIAVNEESAPSSLLQGTSAPLPQSSTGLPFDEEAKLVYGVILSLRNLIRKLSGRYGLVLCQSTQLLMKGLGMNSLSTTVHQLTNSHLYETVSGYKFVHVR